MEALAQSRVDEYRATLVALYDEVRDWLRGVASVEQRAVDLNEAAVGAYAAPTLVIRDNAGAPVAEMRPVGLSIIGAKGRVDLVGRLDTQPIVYLVKGGPALRTSVSTGGKESEATSTPMLRGVGDDGWYWIEDKRRGRALALDKSLFLQLLLETSAREF